MNPRIAVGIGALAVNVACASAGRLAFREPTVELAEVQIVGIGLTGGTLNMVLDIHNPNGYEIRTARLAAAIDLEDVHFGEAVLEQRLRLAPEAATLVDVPVRFTWEGIGVGARSLLTKGAVIYVLRGSVMAETPWGEQPITVSSGGTVSLRDLVR